MYTASDLKKGLKIMFEGQPWIITDFDFSKPGKGQAIYNCRLRNMLNGSGKTCSFRSNDRFEKPDLAQTPLVYSYEDNGTYVFNDADYNEIRVSKEILGDKTYFLTDGLEVDALLYQDAVIDTPSSSARSSSATPASAATPPPARSPSPAPSRAAISSPCPSSSTRATSSASTRARASMPTA